MFDLIQTVLIVFFGGVCLTIAVAMLTFIAFIIYSGE